MNMYPALSIQRSGLNQLSNLGASGAMSSSFPALPPLLDDKDSNYTDSFHVSSGREPMENPISTQAASLVSNSSIICGQLHASSPGLRHDVHFSSVSCHGRHPQDSPFISQSSMEEASFPPCHSSQLDAQSAVLINHLDGNQDISWCSFPLQDIVTFPENVSVQNGQVESSTGVMKSEDHARTDLEWVDRWINTDLEADWNELPDVNVADPEPKQSQIHQQQQQQPPVPSGELCGVANTFSNAPPSKSRMRWTQELHEAFVQAVNQLGGSERATPKGIKNLMKVEGLTIYHVKSHLQKYRTARYKPDSSEGTSEKKLTPTEELKSIDLKAGRGITEALRLQMELQKRLHEQLENQKKLQLEIEKQGQYLEEIFKEQRRMEDGRTKVSVSTMDNPSAPLPNMVQPSHVDDKSETSKADQVKSGPGTSSVNITPEDCSWDGSRKHKAHESRNAEDQEPGDGDSNATPSKRARGDQMAMSSTES
ncbi:hypothetical protein F2P56_018780 [Juglans regia]|uniref:HTH myb-type domain-containing protein n=2 Tax=Juglans regia TaxID=51240 RepID=A0A833WRZ0_JUGRE|nr:protein PHR1-LIKE 1-like [Juglans regia]KAF5462803.1 hypothetical protein F2P56_018780 [Juglans regia]